MTDKKIVLSGVQPSGDMTIGNYLGAIKNWTTMQDSHDCLFCVVDLHAITVPQEPKKLRDNILNIAATYIACGLDPNKVTIFQQSNVPEHLELSWILTTITPLGWLNRMTQFKDKASANKDNTLLGLYSYPVLMAADILLYNTDIVPVGDDQLQHIELTRDVAGAFNRKYDIDYFKMPNAMVNNQSKRIMSLKDGTKKMSKSDPSDDSRINLIDDNDTIVKKIKRAKTDSISGITEDLINRPEVTNLLNMYATFANMTIEGVLQNISDDNTGTFKSKLADLIISEVSPIRTKILNLQNNKDWLLRILNDGKARAQQIASQTIKEVYQIVGFTN